MDWCGRTYAVNSKAKQAFWSWIPACWVVRSVDHTFPLTSPTGKAGRGSASSWLIVNYEKAVKCKAFSWTQGTSSFQVLHKAGVLTPNILEMGLVCQSCTQQMRKLALFQIAGKLPGTSTDQNRYKSLNLSSLVTHYLSKPHCWQAIGLANQRLSLWAQTDKFKFHVNIHWCVSNFCVQSIKGGWN